MKIICVIPTYNCGPQISRVLNKLANSTWKEFQEIWVIDNGSSDSTPEIANSLGKSLGILNLKVFSNSRNVNLGGTHKLAFREAEKIGATHVLILHGDDQAEAAESSNLIVVSARNGGSTVLGSRFMEGSRLSGYDLNRVVGNRVLNFIYSAVTGKWLTDLGSGLNLFALKDVRHESVNSFGNTLSFNYELILFLVRGKKEFQYSPISWSEKDQVSNARNWFIFFSALRILWTWLIRIPKKNNANLVTDVRWVEVR